MVSLVITILLCATLAVCVNLGGTGYDNTAISPKTSIGIIIDAGSGGSRLHIFHWKPRIFKSLPPPISFPDADEKWTAKMAPGVADFSNNLEGIEGHLAPLIDFAVASLAGFEKSFGDIPIYFMATGGMRELPLASREEMMVHIRRLLSSKKFCPFYFHPNFARVISGEEEAAYSWAAVNFLFGNLLPSNGTSPGKQQLYGTVDLGGASSQISFFLPSEDISEGLFKLNLGASVHWNIYTKSFLSFGHNSARRRHFEQVADDSVSRLDPHSAEVPSAVDYCFFSGYSEFVQSSAIAPSFHSHNSPQPSSASFLSSSSNGPSAGKVSPPTPSPTTSQPVAPIPWNVRISGPPVPTQDQFSRCLEAIQPLLVKYTNDYCMVVYNGQCSINGAYQPSLAGIPFIGTSTYTIPWELLLLPTSASLIDYRSAAERFCAMSFTEVLIYFEKNNIGTVDKNLAATAPDFCFIVTYTYMLLLDGYGFEQNQSFTVTATVNGHSVGWALGAILYEINSMPWSIEAEVLEESWTKFSLTLSLGIVIGAVLAYLLLREKHFIWGVRKEDPLAKSPHVGELFEDLKDYDGSIHGLMLPSGSDDNGENGTRTPRNVWSSMIQQQNPFANNYPSYQSLASSENNLEMTFNQETRASKEAV